MGKRIIQQRRGRGTSTYRVRRRAYRIKIAYPPVEGEGKIVKIFSLAGFTAPVALIKVGNRFFYNVATEGLEEGQSIIIGKNAESKQSNILPLRLIPLGTNVCNIEVYPYSGGQLVRAGGLSGVITKKIKDRVAVLLPSKKEKLIDENSRATIGIVAGGGRTEKPWVKAGKKWHEMKARNKLWPRTSPVKMNAVAHPFGGGRGKNIGKTTIAPRFAPPGRKVGLIRPRKTGRGR